MKQGLVALGFCLAAGGCAPSGDPAQGGFINAVAGLSGGGYEARVAEREQGVAVSQARGVELDAELARLQGEHSTLKDRIIQQRAALRSKGVTLTAKTETQIQAALLSEPAQADPQVRAAALQQAIADARGLSEQLSELGT